MSTHSSTEYGWDSDSGPESCGYIIPEILRLLKSLPGSSVVDLGSGNGALAAAIYGERFQVIGVERDSAGVEIAQKLYPQINFYRCGFEDDPAAILIAEEKFDIAVSTEVIEHLYAPHTLLNFAEALLKPGGYLILTTPYHGYLKNLALSLMGKWDHHHTALWYGGHIKFWSRRTLIKLLAENGFKFISFSGVGRVPYLWKSMVLVFRANRT